MLIELLSRFIYVVLAGGNLTYGGDNTLGISQKKNGPAVLQQY